MATYGIIEELMKPTVHFHMMVILGLASLGCSVYVLVAMIYPAECLKVEGHKTAVITSQIMNKVECNDGQKLALIFFITQIKARNVIVQNALFKFEWRTFLVVSKKKYFNFKNS